MQTTWFLHPQIPHSPSDIVHVHVVAHHWDTLLKRRNITMLVVGKSKSTCLISHNNLKLYLQAAISSIHPVYRWFPSQMWNIVFERNSHSVFLISASKSLCFFIQCAFHCCFIVSSTMHFPFFGVSLNTMKMPTLGKYPLSKKYSPISFV